MINPELSMSRYEYETIILSISRCENNYCDLFLEKNEKE